MLTTKPSHVLLLEYQFENVSEQDQDTLKQAMVSDLAHIQGRLYGKEDSVIKWLTTDSIHFYAFCQPGREEDVRLLTKNCIKKTLDSHEGKISGKYSIQFGVRNLSQKVKQE